MESDSSDVERLPDLESLDDFLASSFGVDDEDEVEGSQENTDSLGLEPYRFKPFMEGAEDGDSDSELPSDWDFGLFTLFCTDSFCGFTYYLLSRATCSTWGGGGGSGNWGNSPGKDYGALGYLLHCRPTAAGHMGLRCIFDSGICSSQQALACG